MTPKRLFATLSAQGSVTIPAQVRAALGVGAGDRVAFVPVAPGRFELVAANLPPAALKGMVAAPKEAVSVDDMNRAIRCRAGNTQTL